MTIPVDSFLSNAVEWHNLLLGLSTGIIALWLGAHRPHAATVLVLGSSLSIYVNFGLIGGRANPWYFLVPMALVFLANSLYQSRADTEPTTGDPLAPADYR